LFFSMRHCCSTGVTIVAERIACPPCGEPQRLQNLAIGEFCTPQTPQG
jgi:hypothetical protein